MKERPILFSGPMISPIMEDRKTQTRRVVKTQPPSKFPFAQDGTMGGVTAFWWTDRDLDLDDIGWWPGYDDQDAVRCPYGSPGDRLFVKETWRVAKHHDSTSPRDLKPRSMTVQYRAGGFACNDASGWTFFDDEPSGVPFGKWRPSIFMPRWASRITLEITGVRVERLNQISEADAKAEGIGSWRQKYPRGSHDIQGYDTVYNFGRDLETRWFPTSSPNAVLSYKRLWESINGPGSWEANHFVWVIEFRRVQ